MTPDLKLDQDGDVLRIVLNRPAKRNALTRGILRELLQAIQSVTSTTRLVTLSAEGSVFCAGMDLQEMQATASMPNAEEIWQQDSDLYRQVVEALFFTACPTLCVVQGPVLAGGAGLVLACDLVVATESATFALPEPKRGITASMVSPLLVHRIGAGPASWLLLSGQTLTATNAARFGLIHELLPGSTWQTDVANIVRSIQMCAPGALRVTKLQLVEGTATQLRADWDRAAKLSAQSRGTAEAREGLQAFLEKRIASWMGEGE